jgi:hypothetical protein
MKLRLVKQKALEERHKNDINHYVWLAKRQATSNYRGVAIEVPTNISHLIESKLDEEGIPCSIPTSSYIHAGDTIKLYVAGSFSMLEAFIGA